MNRSRILDIDLDFFLNHKHIGTVTSENRLDDSFYLPWEENLVRQFLEEKLGLRKSRKIKGQIFKHHVEVYYFLKNLSTNNDQKFDIDHIDAHADLGQGDMSYWYISQEILTMPLYERKEQTKFNGYQGLSSGNFLTFAVASRWVEQLRYINKISWTDDIPWFNMMDFDSKSGFIQLKQFSEKQLQTILNNGMIEEARRQVPISFEPKVPFEVIDYKDFSSDGNYDYFFLTESPGFTPKSSDKLIPIFKDYMEI